MFVKYCKIILLPFLILGGEMLLGQSPDSQPVFIIDFLFEKHFIEPEYLQMLYDSNEVFSIENVQNQPFFPTRQFPIPNQRKFGSVYWTKLILDNQLEVNRELWLFIPANYSFGYLIGNSGKIKKSRSGIMMPFKEKTIQAQRQRTANFIPVNLRPKEKATLFIQSRFAGGNPPLTEISLIQTPQNAAFEHLKAKNKVSFVNGFFQAIILFLIVYCLFYAFWSGELFAYMLTGYCLFMGIYFLNADQYLYELGWTSNAPHLINILGINMVNLSLIFNLLFTITFLDLKNRLPVWNKVLIGLTALDVFFILTVTGYYILTGHQSACVKYISLFQLIYLITLPVFLIRFWLIKNFRVRIYTVAASLGFLCWVLAWGSYYIFLNIEALFFLKLGVALYVAIILISLSYYAARTGREKLVFEKEAGRQHLISEQQRNQRLEAEKEKNILEIQTRELQKLNQLKSRFFANVSHELRTPLTLILGPIEAALKRNQLKDNDLNSLLTAQKNGKRLRNLVNEILDLTKLEAGKLDLNLSPVLWYPFLRTVASNFESLAKHRKINFQFIYEGNQNLQVSLDKKKTETVLNNLLSNAFKFTKPGDTVSIKAKNDAQFLHFEIKDTGRGIPEKDLPHIFDRFYQVPNQKGTAEGGTGIGLALSKEYIRLMEGSIRAESVLGTGTVFSVSIPRTEVMGQLSDEEILNIQSDDSEAQKSKEQKTVEGLTTNSSLETKPLILLAEDNLDLQNYIHSLLRDDYEIIIANNGREALERLGISGNKDLSEVSENETFEPVKPDLIISDIMMPFTDGYQLLNKLKQNERFSLIPVIILSARASMDDKLKALRIGVDDYLIKPFDAEELLIRVKNLLENSMNRKLAFQENSTVSIEKPSENIEQIILTKEARVWLDEVEKLIKNNLGKINYTVDDLADEMNMSKRQLYRQINQLIGQTPNQYIKSIRLNTAREWLQSGQFDSVKAVAFSVGFKDVVYFSRQFKKEFGKLPSGYGFEG